MTLPSLIACVAYALVAALCAISAYSASTTGRPAAESRAWLCGVACFILLAVSRITSFESNARDFFRQLMIEQGQYSDRWTLQAPFAVAGVLTGAAICWLAWYRWPPGQAGRRRKLTFIAMLGMAGFVPLFMLRIISLHATDALLYGGGALRLNWLIDGTLTATVGICAACYLVALRSAGKRRQRGAKAVR